MKVAIIGSRGPVIRDLERYLPAKTTEVVSGGAAGVDACAKEFALKNKIKYTEFLPEYEKYKKGAPLKRNIQIIEYADLVIAFWNGRSKGTRHVIEQCKSLKKNIRVILFPPQGDSYQ